MKIWKADRDVRKAYDDLYSPVDSNNESSETILSIIIRNVFVSEVEHTRKNAVWTQAILEIIFDESYLSPKVESDSVDRWYAKLIKVSIILYWFLLFLSFFIVLTSSILLSL